MFYFAYSQLLADLDALEAAVDTAQSNVTDMASMVPIVKEQFEKNQEQLNIAEKNAMDAHNQSQQAQQVTCDQYLSLSSPTPPHPTDPSLYGGYSVIRS